MSFEQYIERHGQLEGMLVDINSRLKSNRKQMLDEIKHCIREFDIKFEEMTQIYESLNLPISRRPYKWEMSED